MINLTLLVTVYKPLEKDIVFWKNFYIENRNEIEIQFLIDNPAFENYDWINSKDVFLNNENIGKFKTVYYHLKNNKINNEHVKIVDPDDQISIQLLRKLPKLKKRTIYHFNVTRGEEIRLKNEDEVFKVISKTEPQKWTASFGNSWTILPVSNIKKDKYYSGRDIWAADDQLLAFISLANNAKVSSVDLSFYYYTLFNGNTSCSKLTDYLQNVIETFEEIKNIVKISGMKKYSNWPNGHKFSEGRVLECKHTNYIENLEILKKLKKINIYEK